MRERTCAGPRTSGACGTHHRVMERFRVYGSSRQGLWECGGDAVTLQDGHEERSRVPKEVGGKVGDQASSHGHDTIAEGRLGKPGRAERVRSVCGAG
jgi:hypothetical protein